MTTSTQHGAAGYRIEHGTKPSQSRLIASCSCGAELVAEYRYNDLQHRTVERLMREHLEGES